MLTRQLATFVVETDARNIPPKVLEGSRDALIDTIPIEPYDLEVARTHAALLAHTYREGRPRGAHDLVIAATARRSGRTVVTADPGGFVDLPQVRVRVLGGAP